MAAKKWLDLRGDTPPPETVEEALDRQEEIPVPDEILTVRDGQFWRVISRRYNAAAAKQTDWVKELDDEIPF